MLRKETLTFLNKHELVVDPSQDEQQLIDPEIIQLLIKSAGVQPGDRVMEVGPGAGNITIELARQGAKVIGIEKNPKWISLLKERLNEFNVELIIGDALKDKLPEFDRVVSNLPYSISEAFMQRLTRLTFMSGAFLVPSSFATTVKAQKGDEKFSKLSFISGLFFDSEIITSVPQNAYHPPPGTSTSILTVTPRLPSKLGEVLLRETLKQSDKKLGNGLREAVIKGAITYDLPSTKKSADKYITGAFRNLNPECRVGRLSLMELQRLSIFLDDLKVTSG
jgi:16S rRNA (adenine1518-N6/adenine1519-N6)-dimethyltransferase